MAHEKRTPHPIRERAGGVDFALQAVDDPSLVVSAPDVWSDGPELTAMGRHVTHPDEHLLRGLGQAARLVPALGSALASAAPCEYTTDAAGILTFLRRRARPCWKRPGSECSLPRGVVLVEDQTRTEAQGADRPRGWEYHRHDRSRRNFRRHPLGSGARRRHPGADRAPSAGPTEQQPLVRVRGRWVELHHDEISAAITVVGQRGASADVMPAGEVLRSALGFDHGPEGLPVVDVVADGWLGHLLSGAEDRTLKSTPTP